MAFEVLLQLDELHSSNTCHCSNRHLGPTILQLILFTTVFVQTYFSQRISQVFIEAILFSIHN